MAAAKSHVDSSVAERRLRPIYDWLDGGNNKRALQEADKVLKKQPNFLCAKVLRALALLRMGKNEDCEVILEEVKQETPTNDPTLQAMTICYREMHQTDKICDVYAAAVAREPNNEELLTHLFMAYVRIGDFKKQQQTAMALYKLKPKNPYYFWGVMSVVMQARDVPDATARNIMLPLAERMVVKMIDSGRIDAEQEVQLYLMILEMQDKMEEALRVLDGPLGERLVSHLGFLHTKKATLLSKLGKWRDSHLLYKTLISQEQDRWNYYCEYFKTAFELWSSPNLILEEDRLLEKDESWKNNVILDPDALEIAITEGKQSSLWWRVDTSPKACIEFLNVLQDVNEQRGDKRLRAPLLAKLELYSRLVDSPQEGFDPQTVLGDSLDLIELYFQRFGAKPSCFSDLKKYMRLVPSERSIELLGRLSQTLECGEFQLPTNLSQLRRHISLMQLQRYMGNHETLSIAEKLALVTDLLRRYDHGATFEQELIPTDFRSNDPYVQLVCHILIELALRYGQDTRLQEAASILEHALTLSPSNFHFKLLLLRIYSVVGAGSAAQSAFELLDVKHLQLDSLGWLHCAHLSSTGHIAMASAHYEATLKFFTSNYKDSVDHLTFSYKFGSFNKIVEFVEFRNRLHHSHHYTRCTVERMLSELMMASSHEHASQVFENSVAVLYIVNRDTDDPDQSIQQMDITPAEDSTEWEKLWDNRDLEVTLTYDPPNKQLSPEIVECTFRREIAVVRLRSLQLRCLGAAYELVNSPAPMEETIMKNGESQENVLSSLISQIVHFYLPPIPASQSQLNHPIPCRADAIPGSPHIQAFVAGLKLVNQLAELCQDLQANPVPVLESMVVVLGAVLEAEKAAESLLDNDHSPLTRRTAIEAAVNALETLSFMALLCGIYQNLARPNQPSSARSKRGKKKKQEQQASGSQQPSQVRVLKGLSELATRLHGVCNHLSEAVGRWEARVALADAAAEALGKWTLQESEDPPPQHDAKQRSRAGVADAVSAKLRHSYMDTAKELQSILTLKMKHFSQYTSKV